MLSIPFNKIVVASLLLFHAAGCTSQSTPPPTAPVTQGPRVFDSPAEAVDALVAALRTNNVEELKSIFGPRGDDIISSGDPVADRAERERFIAAYDSRHFFQSDLSGGMNLVVGDQEWPFPVPIVVTDDDGYMFETATGREEILNRRIGRNELSAVQVCLAIVDAQRDYVTLRPTGSDLPVYASKIVSDPGTKDGLYWPAAEGQPESPLGPLVAAATSQGYGNVPQADRPQPYHGYKYRLLTRQGDHATGGAMDYIVDGKLIGGFAVVAYPAEYGKSGITTFITNHDGIVYQQDLGPDTQRIAGQMTDFDPGPGWTPVSDQPAAVPATQPAPAATRNFASTPPQGQ
jgi:DUF2950 family protein